MVTLISSVKRWWGSINMCAHIYILHEFFYRSALSFKTNFIIKTSLPIIFLISFLFPILMFPTQLGLFLYSSSSSGTTHMVKAFSSLSLSLSEQVILLSLVLKTLAIYSKFKLIIYFSL